MKFLFFIVLFLHSLLVLGQKELRIENGFEQKVLGKELGIFNDTDGNLSPQEVLRKDFRQIKSPRPNLGFTSGAFWLKSRIENNSDQSEFILQVNAPTLDTLTFYLLDKSGNIVKQETVGEAFAEGSAEMAERNFRFRFKISKGVERTVLLRVATVEQVSIPIYILTPEASWIMERNTDLLFGAYFGIILIMILYNLFIFLTVKDISYLYYVIYVFFVGITQAALEGYTHLFLWPDNFWISSRSVYIFTALVSISSVAFLRNFLKTKLYAPKLHPIAAVLYSYFGAILIAVLFSANKTVHIASQVGIMLVAVYIYTTSITVFRKGYRPAKFFLLAWTILIVGIVVYALKDAGLIASNPFTNYLLLVGSTVEILILSLALADRINILEQEMASAQNEALAVSLENEKIVHNQNIVLEQKVNERTNDLEKINAVLIDAIDELRHTQSQLVNAEKMASLGQLTAGVAHEINNPINFVLANVQPLKYDVADLLRVIDIYDSINSEEDFRQRKPEIEKMKLAIDLDYTRGEIEQLLDGLQDGARRTAEIVKGMKDFSRVDDSDLREYNLNESISSTLFLLRNKTGDDISINKMLGDIPKVECLGGKINQVFMNVLNNGIQALQSQTDTKNPELNIKSWNDKEFVYFSIGDNGPGIPENIIKHIFEPFFTTRHTGEGTGLGLSISFSIIELHKGSIEVESVEREGATFTIKLPIEAQIDFNTAK